MLPRGDQKWLQTPDTCGQSLQPCWRHFAHVPACRRRTRRKHIARLIWLSVNRSTSFILMPTSARRTPNMPCRSSRAMACAGRRRTKERLMPGSLAPGKRDASRWSRVWSHPSRLSMSVGLREPSPTSSSSAIYPALIAAATSADTVSQSRGVGGLNSRTLGYQGVSLRFSSQRQSGA